MKTRTGRFPIGFRRGRGWQDNTTDLADWAGGVGFEAVDLGEATAEDIRVLRDHGLRVGTCDLLSMALLLSPDEGERKEAVRRNIDYFKKLTGLGIDHFFTAVIPKDPGRSRSDNYSLALATLDELAHAAADLGAMIVIEGWPGVFPYYANLCCTPETCRRILAEVNSPGLGVNYDPSHLIRMGIDHIRFLEEFAGRVGHVHAKDAEILGEAIYEYGITQTSVFEPQFYCGENYWRYTIPGHGQARWLKAFQILEKAGWEGIVSVELEDQSFHGSSEAEKLGLACSLAFLQTV